MDDNFPKYRLPAGGDYLPHSSLNYIGRKIVQFWRPKNTRALATRNWQLDKMEKKARYILIVSHSLSFPRSTSQCHSLVNSLDQYSFQYTNIYRMCADSHPWSYVRPSPYRTAYPQSPQSLPSSASTPANKTPLFFPLSPPQTSGPGFFGQCNCPSLDRPSANLPITGLILPCSRLHMEFIFNCSSRTAGSWSDNFRGRSLTNW